jgi:hypothetical protein
VLLGSLLLALAVAPILPTWTAGAAAPPGTPVLHQSAELVSIPLGTNTFQGQDVALSADGSTLAVAGVNRASLSTVVYVRSGDRWLTQTMLRSPLTFEGQHDNAGGIAISADGDTLAVGAPAVTVSFGDTDLSDAGEVYLFTRSGQTWRAAGRLVAPQPLRSSTFGEDVSVSGDGSRVLVGQAGHAYIADTGSLVVRELPAPAGSLSFGGSVAISPDGETAVTGDGFNPAGDGGAFVLVDDPVRGWIQRWHLEPQPGQDGSFGFAVAVTDTDTVVVGAPRYDHGPPYTYGVSVFDRRGASLVRTARFTPRYDTQARGLGRSVAVSADGSTVVAGAPYRNGVGAIRGAGAGYRWVRRPGGWSWAGLLSVAHPHAYEYQGDSTAVSGDGRVVVLGAPLRSSARLGETGAAIVFSAVQ